MSNEELLASVVNKLDILEQLRSSQAISDDRIKRIQTDNEQHRLQLQAVSTQISAIDSKVTALCAGCEERHKRISDEIDTLKGQSASTRRALGKHVDEGRAREDMTGPVAIPQSATDVVKLLDEREEARAKRQRQWLIWGIPLFLALLGAPQVRQCIGEERAARVEQAVQRLEAKPATVVKVPVPQPVPVPVPVNGGGDQ